MRRAILRLAISTVIVVAVLALCLRVPSLHRATVALMMVLAIVGLARKWGWPESLIAAVVGGIGFLYYFLPPRGLHLGAFEDLVDLIAFVVTALVTSQIVVRSKRGRIEAEERKDDMQRALNAQLTSELSAMTRMQQLSMRLVQTGEFSKLLEGILDGAVEITGADKGNIQLLENDVLKIVAQRGFDAPFLDFFNSVKHYDPVACGAALQRSERVIVEDVANSPIFAGAPALDVMLSAGVRAVQSTPLLSRTGQVLGMFSTHHCAPHRPDERQLRILDILARQAADLIERTRAEERLHQSEELKAAALDAMAHEIRNPLNSAKLAATTLLSEHAGSELDKREMLTIIEEELNRADGIIDETVHLARVEASQLFLRKEPVNLARLIPAAIEEMRVLASRRPIRMSVPEPLPPVECDKDMIARVLHQLLSNALKYSPDDSLITVSAEFAEAAILIEVVDRGPGVDEEERDRIFEKYYRGRAARPGKSGTGLGLPSARSIVRAHGGEIWVTRPPDGGAAFHVSLPVTNGQRAAGG